MCWWQWPLQGIFVSPGRAWLLCLSSCFALDEVCCLPPAPRRCDTPLPHIHRKILKTKAKYQEIPAKYCIKMTYRLLRGTGRAYEGRGLAIRGSSRDAPNPLQTRKGRSAGRGGSCPTAKV